EESPGGVGEIGKPLPSADVERVQLSVGPLELGEARHEPGLVREWTAGVVNRPEGGDAGEAGGARRPPLDRLRPEADLLADHTGCQVLGHGTPLAERLRDDE